jgi:AmmeMemoRadiSam system protein B
MASIQSYLFLLLLSLFPFLAALAQAPSSPSVRPIRDSVGFCWSAKEMDNFMAFLQATDSDAVAVTGRMVGAISVHDDYLYAGRVYYPLFKHIHTKEVIIFGVTHGSVRKEMGPQRDQLILDAYKNWQGPYGDIAVSSLREEITAKLNPGDFKISNQAHRIEHSIEAMLPFLQYYNRELQITPIMVPQMTNEQVTAVSERLARVIAEYCRAHHLEPGKDIFFLISNDANHYGEDFANTPYGMDERAHRIATENDRNIINKKLTGSVSLQGIRELTACIWPDSTKKDIPLWCGRYPIAFGLMTVARVVRALNNVDMSGELLRYSDSFTEKVLPFKGSAMGLTAVFSYRHWCGWFTEAFTVPDK